MISKKKFSRIGLAAALFVAVVAAGGAWASAAEPAEPAEMPSIVEDYSYPGAEAIFEERGIKLYSGSGTIVLADCPGGVTNELIWVRTISGYVCFEAKSNIGHLKLEIVDAFSIRGDNNDGVATITVDGDTERIQLEKGTWRPIGAGADDTKGLAVVLEIRLT